VRFRYLVADMRISSQNECASMSSDAATGTWAKCCAECLKRYCSRKIFMAEWSHHTPTCIKVRANFATQPPGTAREGAICVLLFRRVSWQCARTLRLYTSHRDS